MIYIIRTRDNDRSKDLQKVLNDGESEFKLIDGFIGSKITNPGFKYQCYEGGTLFNPRPMAKGELGVMISHTMAITMAKAYNEPYVIIFEDDARIPDNFSELFDRIKMKDADILMLGGILLRKDTNVGPKIGKYIRRVQNTKIYGMHAYVIFEKAYDKVLDILYSQANACDDLVLGNKELDIYMADPWIAYQEPGKSIIWPDREENKQEHSRFLYKK